MAIDKKSKIYFGDNYEILKNLPSNSIDLIYIDPPFNTGKSQKMERIKTIRSENGDRKGFNGERYETIKIGEKAFPDSFSEYIKDFLYPRMKEAYRVLASHGSLYFHIDYREVHYCKIMLDLIFNKDNFINEIIWAYDYGGKAKTRWPAKHDNILYYRKDTENYIYNVDSIDRIPYLAKGLVSQEKWDRGKLPTDTWWHSIVGTNSKERNGYPTQKPVKLLERIILASSNEGNTVLDFFAGSGTIGECCLKNNRNFILIDNNPVAMEVMSDRFSGETSIDWIGFDPTKGNKNEQPK